MTNNLPENVLTRVASEKIRDASLNLPDPSVTSAEFMEAETTDIDGRPVALRFYRLKLTRHRNTWHIWTPDRAHYIQG